MPLFAFGLNHKTAPLALRERFHFTTDYESALVQDLLSSGAANEALVLCTCNRTEFYLAAENLTAARQWLQQRLCLDFTNDDAWYMHTEQEAVRHLLRVANGLDSLVLGEPQILGQLKTAYVTAQRQGAIGAQLSRLLPAVFATAKHIRALTQVGANPLSMAYIVVKLAKTIFTDLSRCGILLVGVSPMIEIAASHLAAQGCKRLIFANRTRAKAEALAAKYQAHVISLADIPVYLPQADITLTATRSPLPLIGKGAVERALKLRKHRPMFMADLAVPRDIETAVARLSDIYLYDLDNLTAIIETNLKSREYAAQQAETMVEIETRHFMREAQTLNATATICAYREKIQQLGQHSLVAATQALQRGAAPEAVLQKTIHELVNKMLHAPSKQLRQAAYDGRQDILTLAKQLFDL